MDMRSVQLIDQTRTVLAVAQVADEGGYFGGSIDLRFTPTPLRALFEEFEEIVNGQMFVFLDEIQEKIGSLPIKAVFGNGVEDYIKNLQVFPSTGDVSFHLVGTPAQVANQA